MWRKASWRISKNSFTNKNRPIKPLTLREVAQEIDVHESTVSRAVNGKYLETEFGVFELKNSLRIASKSGNMSEEDLSADTAQKESKS